MIKIKKGDYYKYKSIDRLLIVEKVCRKYDIIVLSVVKDRKLKTYMSKQSIIDSMLPSKIGKLLYG